MATMSTTAAPETAAERDARRALRVQASATFVSALEDAASALGQPRVQQILDEHGWMPDEDHSDCAEPHDQDRLDAAARLVHAPHDRFSWRLCAEETCRALREV